MASGTPALADKNDNNCDKNEDKNCNHSEKNQKSSPKINCEIHIDAEDHLNNNEFGPNEQQCLNNSNNIKDSTVIQNPPSNGEFDSPTVVSVDPNDNQNNVPLNTEIKVTFDENMDQDTLDDGSLNIFNLDTGVDPGVNANPSSKSVTYTLDRPLEPGTRYEAELDSNIQDEDGNFLDCSNSNAVDSSCRWQFETTGSSSGNIELSPTSGPFDTPVSVSGTNFAPNSNVIITFGLIQQQIRQTDNNGDFDAEFAVIQTVPGPLTVTASDGSSSAQATFRVTSSPPENPIIGLNDTLGPVGTPVNIIGINFDPDSEVTITFRGNGTVTTATTSSLGVFSANFTVPTSTIGQHTVTATDEGSNSDSTIFTVSAQSTLSANEHLPTREPDIVASTPSSPNLSEKMILPDIFA